MDSNYRLSVNIAIVGPVSVGKSTLLNALFTKTYSDMKLRRTTMIPQIYHETDNENQYKDKPAKLIRAQNTEINKKILEMRNAGTALKVTDIAEMEYYVPRIPKFVNLLKNVYLSIYDIPGLNDNGNSTAYFDYLSSNFHKFDVVILVFDVNSGINTTDEIKILDTILQLIDEHRKKYDMNKHLIVLANKCDDMVLDENSEYQLGEEQEENRKQMSDILIEKTSKYPNLTYDLIPICAEDSYIYRMIDALMINELDIKYINKVGLNECGRKHWKNKMDDSAKRKMLTSMLDADEIDIKERLKTVGFGTLIKSLKKIIESHDSLIQYNWLLDRIKYGATNLDNSFNKVDISTEITQYVKYYNRSIHLRKEYDVVGAKSDSMYIIEKMCQFIKGYISHIEQYITSPQDNITNILAHVKKITEILVKIKKTHEYTIVLQETVELLDLTKVRIHTILVKKQLDCGTQNIIDNLSNILDKLHEYEADCQSFQLVKSIINQSNITGNFKFKTESFITIIDDIVNKKYLTSQQIVQLLCTYILELYKIYSQQNNCNYSRMINTRLFWDNISAPFSNPFFKLLYGLKTELNNSIFNMPTEFIYIKNSMDDMPVVELYLIKYINQVYEKKVLINNYLDMVFHIENNDYLKRDENVSNV